jgi:hypothetical protein
MRSVAFALAFLAATPALAQEPDTTDWHRYVPLAVGNAWQHQVERGTLPYPIETYFVVAEIVGTREVDGQTYFEVVECFRAADDPEPCLTSGPHTLVRYDEETASVVARVETGGTTTHVPWSYYPCGLDAPSGFDITVSCPDGEVYVWPYVLWDLYPEYWLLDGELPGTVKEKHYSTLASAVTVASDVGLVRAGFGDPGCSECINLIYARLDGVEYGEQAVMVRNEEGAPQTPASLTVSPNPLRSAATLRFALAAPEQLTLEVYDVRGRLVRTDALDALGSGEHAVRFEAGDLPPGAYRLRLTGDGGFVAARGVIVLP